MKRILILVEGQTEETFVREVLAPHLLRLGLALIPRLVVTKYVKEGGSFKGGVPQYALVQGDLRRLLGDTGAACVTSMLDYYGLPKDFPGLTTRPQGSCYARVDHVERAFAEDIGHRGFLPHLVLHEFEALLFTDPGQCSISFSTEEITKLQAIRANVQSPEEINEHPDTAPSKRVLAVSPGYQKTLHGPLAVMSIGLPAIRAACPHFAQWLSKLEALAEK
ncbi:hypothetical protein COCOR_07852 [Corallococcus coralloides DSM 2259]|uniref:DUF4276 family protein n=1 Tax=Corallococcus coralloides (strain ATCC 25202 / DSM 2259 / NBRC 100086 / M2) TaxID=1144275 RepID=H8MUX7_CORCM|nr:DUF4276 family protein [Corallococcus coralloides]AFE07776.1 hypothetical protein COCOR_07852 [Corallococcus coralloides DSM 2259]